MNVPVVLRLSSGTDLRSGSVLDSISFEKHTAPISLSTFSHPQHSFPRGQTPFGYQSPSPENALTGTEGTG